MYYLFVIKDNLFKNDKDYLFELLYKIKNMKKENYSYGISLYYSICIPFKEEIIKNYLNNKFKLNYINNIYYINKNNYFKINKSYCMINSNKYLRDILCIFYIYNKNIFVCNFKEGKYFWLEDKFK